MNIKRMSYRRGANLGDYESVHIEIEAEFGDDDKKEEVYKKLKRFVDSAITYEVEVNKKIQRNDRGARI